MLLAGLLVCTLALATMLAYEAHNAAQSHRATAERALHDYAAVAAWELVAGVNEELQSSAGGALMPLTRARATSPYEPLASPAALVSSADNVLRCSPPDESARFYFRIDLRDGSVVTAGAAVSPAMRAWLGDSILAHGRNVYQPDWSFAVVFGGPRGERPSAIVYGLKYAEHNAPIAAFGFRTCRDAMGQSMIRDVIARHPLLPASVSGLRRTTRSSPSVSSIERAPSSISRPAHNRRLTPARRRWNRSDRSSSTRRFGLGQSSSSRLARFRSHAYRCSSDCSRSPRRWSESR